MRKKILVLLFIFISAIFAYSLTLKVGSLAPRNSPWDKTLSKIADEWKTASNGRVQLKIYPGGITGNEEDTLRKLRIGALDGMVASTIGLNKISSDLFAISLPLILRDEDELDFVMDRIYPTYSTIIEDKGFKLVGWTKAGWMNVFSRDPVYYPADMDHQKLGFAAGEVVLTKILKNMGFHIVPADTIDMLASLQSGRADALILSPLIATAYQIFPLADNMLDFQISSLLGAIVFNERSWKKIPEEYRQSFIDIVKENFISVNKASRELDSKALTVMLENGLTVNSINTEQKNAWLKLVDSLYEKEGIIGSLVSRDIYDEIVSYTNEYRNNPVKNGN